MVETFDRVNLLLLRVSVVFAIASGVLVGAPPADAQVSSYDGVGAAAYASQYACNNNPSCRNPAWPVYSQDCTNYVSQAMFVGGDMPMRATDGDSNTVWWANMQGDSSLSWRVVSTFRAFNVDYSHRGGYVSVSKTAAYTPAHKGDLYLYDFGKGEGYDHFAMATNWGTFINYYDPNNKKNYNSVTNRGLRIDAGCTTSRR